MGEATRGDSPNAARTQSQMACAQLHQANRDMTPAGQTQTAAICGLEAGASLRYVQHGVSVRRSTGDRTYKRPMKVRLRSFALEIGRIHIWRGHVSIDSSGGNPTMDYNEHYRTYNGFVRGAKYLISIIAVILILMAIFLV